MASSPQWGLANIKQGSENFFCRHPKQNEFSVRGFEIVLLKVLLLSPFQIISIIMLLTHGADRRRGFNNPTLHWAWSFRSLLQHDYLKGCGTAMREGTWGTQESKSKVLWAENSSFHENLCWLCHTCGYPLSPGQRLAALASVIRWLILSCFFVLHGTFPEGMEVYQTFVYRL